MQQRAIATVLLGLLALSGCDLLGGQSGTPTGARLGCSAAQASEAADRRQALSDAFFGEREFAVTWQRWSPSGASTQGRARLSLELGSSAQAPPSLRCSDGVAVSVTLRCADATLDLDGIGELDGTPDLALISLLPSNDVRDAEVNLEPEDIAVSIEFTDGSRLELYTQDAQP